MKSSHNTYELPERMKRAGVCPAPPRPSCLRWLPPVLLGAGYACIWASISWAMLLYASSESSWLLRLFSLFLTWAGPLLLLVAAVLVFWQAAAWGWRLGLAVVLLLSLPGLLMLVPAVLMLGAALGR